MSNPFVSGLFGAWTTVQVALGVFFFQAYAARRREFEYLLFALVCFSLAVADAGLTLHSYIVDFDQWFVAAVLTHMGAFAATALNIHFVLCLIMRDPPRRYTVSAYVYAALCTVVFVSGSWWEDGSLHRSHREVMGLPYDQMLARPTLVGQLGYAGLVAADLVTLVALYVAFFRGKRELRGAVVGATVLFATAFIDVLYASSTLSLPTLFPYAFLVYAFCVADTLIVRYRHATGELERTAQELRQATNELTHSYLELSAVQEELFKKRQLASVGELAGSIAHEVRNPLAIIRNAAASLRRPAVGTEDKNTLFVIIDEEITRLNNLVAELLRFARPVNVHRESISIVEVLRSLQDRVPGAERLETRFPSDPEVEMVWADANLLKLALGNLIENAMQASPDAEQVTVTVARTSMGEAPGVQVDISDTGHGMDEETCRRARDPFFSTRPSGTGLGLPIAVRIIEAHGGTVELKSRPGEGTTATVRIPSKAPERHSEPRISVELRAGQDSRALPSASVPREPGL